MDNNYREPAQGPASAPQAPTIGCVLNSSGLVTQNQQIQTSQGNLPPTASQQQTNHVHNMTQQQPAAQNDPNAFNFWPQVPVDNAVPAAFEMPAPLGHGALVPVEQNVAGVLDFPAPPGGGAGAWVPEADWNMNDYAADGNQAGHEGETDEYGDNSGGKRKRVETPTTASDTTTATDAATDRYLLSADASPRTSPSWP